MNYEQIYYEKLEVWDNYFCNNEEKERSVITKNLIPSDVQSILDVGCGCGIITNSLVKNLVIGIDLARTPLKYVKLNPIQASIANIPLKKVNIDLIIITEVLEHLDDITFSKAINEILRINPKYLIISTPFNEDLSLQICKCNNCGNLFNPYYHQRSFKPESFQNFFLGYSIAKVTYHSYRFTLNPNLIKIKQKLGIYNYSKLAVCNKCGISSTRQHFFLAYLLDIITFPLKKWLEFKGTKKPYHQILILTKT